VGVDWSRSAFLYGNTGNFPSRDIDFHTKIKKQQDKKRILSLMEDNLTIYGQIEEQKVGQQIEWIFAEVMRICKLI
jgi:hypothetical protein